MEKCQGVGTSLLSDIMCLDRQNWIQLASFAWTWLNIWSWRWHRLGHKVLALIHKTDRQVHWNGHIHFYWLGHENRWGKVLAHQNEEGNDSATRMGYAILYSLYSKKIWFFFTNTKNNAFYDQIKFQNFFHFGK